MFPKKTMLTTVAVPPDKNKTDVVVYMVEDKHEQAAVNHERNRRAAYCACAVVLTSLILVAGALGTAAIVLTHRGRVTSDVEPFREPLYPGVENSFAKIPEAPPAPPVKIDDGGLWPPKPMTPDLVSLDDDYILDDYAPWNSSGDNEVDDRQEENIAGSLTSSSAMHSSSSDPDMGYFSDQYYDSGW